MMVLPIVHLNGTGREGLLSQTCNVRGKVREAMEALAAATPHMRDYYPAPERWEPAMAQHHRRMAALQALLDEFTEQAEAISDL